MSDAHILPVMDRQERSIDATASRAGHYSDFAEKLDSVATTQPNTFIM